MAGPARNTFLNVGHELRRDIRFDTPLLTDGNGNYVEFPFQVPANSLVTSASVVVVTPFNAGTTNTVSIGSSRAGGTAVDITAAQTTAAAGTFSLLTVSGGGRMGASDVTMKLYVVASGTAPTTGDVSVVLRFSPQGT